MKIFILEDSNARIKWFKEVFSSENDLFFADNVEEAKKILLENPEFDVLFLDHDLDQKVFVSPDESNTGYQLTKFIVENKISFGFAYIHSMNFYGSNLMCKELFEISDRVSQIPFSSLKSLFK